MHCGAFVKSVLLTSPFKSREAKKIPKDLICQTWQVCILNPRVEGCPETPMSCWLKAISSYCYWLLLVQWLSWSCFAPRCWARLSSSEVQLANFRASANPHHVGSLWGCNYQVMLYANKRRYRARGMSLYRYFYRYIIYSISCYCSVW